MRVLALDQSTSCCGYCLMESSTKQILLFGHELFSGTNIDEKISSVKSWLTKLIEETKPECFIIEDIQFQNNQRTYKILAELLGVLSNLYFENAYPYEVVSPSSWRSFCGIKGRARKEQKENAISFIKEKYGLKPTEDEAEAICMALYGSNLFEVKNERIE